MKIILALPPDFFPAAFKWTPSTPILYLGAILEKHDYEVKILDPLVEGMSVGAFVDAVAKEAPDVLGMYVTSDAYFTAAKIFRAVKQKLPRIVTIAGGPHPTLLAGSMLESLPGLDVLVRGDGEDALPAILERLKVGDSLKGVPNTSFREEGQIVYNLEQHFVQNLDAYPFPAYHLINFDKYNFTYPVAGKGEQKAVNLITSRGCPFDCLFCSNTNLSRRKVRYRSIDKVIEEIEAVIADYGVSYVWIQDDAFNLSVKHVLEFCDQIEQKRLDIYWSCIMRADNVSKELLSRMKETGFVGGYFAVETIDDQLRQEVIGKKLTMDQVENAINAFNELNLWCGINFLVSLPDETKKELEQNISFMEQLELVHEMSSVNLNVLRIYPGTRLEVEASKRGVLKEGFTWFDERKMRRYSPGVLPGLYGVVPIYQEHLSFVDIFSCLFRWRYSPNFPMDSRNAEGLLSYLWRYVSHIKSGKDIFMLSQIFLAWMKVMAMRIVRSLKASWGDAAGQSTPKKPSREDYL